VAVSVEWFHGSREPLAELFAAADDSPVQLAGYRDRGRVLVALDQGQMGTCSSLTAPAQA
jgi:hypothetical protein